MKKIVIVFLMCFFMCFSVSCSYNSSENAKIIDENNISSSVYGENMTVSRALAAKMICLLFFDDDKCEKNNFYDIAEDMWYFDYANIVFEKNIMVGNLGYFQPLEPITYMEAMKVMKRLGGNDVNYTAKNGDEAVSYTLWCDMIEETLKSTGKNYDYEELSVFITGNGENIDLMKVITNKGVYSYCGLWLDNCIDKTIKAVIKNDKIIYIKEITDEARFENVDLKITEENITATYMGVSREFSCSLSNIKNGTNNIVTKNKDIIGVF